ncbi:hypothetical protein [Streptomyces sp. NPDC048252]|uniref:hypothetical protein n=1 Tax=Streptomyces sp. NPDC048252 TaxID=3154612 RepID=UPI00342FF030
MCPPRKPERDGEIDDWLSGYRPESVGTEPMELAPPEATQQPRASPGGAWSRWR